MAKRKALKRTSAKLLTERAIFALKPGQKRADGDSPPGLGRLIIRARENADGTVVRQFYFRYFDAHGKERSLFIGTHGHMPTVEARAETKRLRDLVKAGADPQVNRDMVAQANREADERVRLESRKGTLADLIDEYVKHLRAAGKVSADDVERTLMRHVTKAFPALAAKRARDITAEDITDIQARMIAKGIERRVNIVRALLRAAFAFGSKRDNDPIRKAEAIKSGGTEAAKLFGISGNPVADVAVITKFNRALERTLSDDELRHYWQSLAPLHPGIGDCLRATLLLGGQRLSQLKRATWDHYDSEDRVLTLTDAKGRGGVREHSLPVSDRVAAILATLRAINPKGYIFSTTGGDKEVNLSTLSSHVTEIARTFWKGSKAKAYSAADIRRTVETRLAAMGVSKDIRAQLLSHGRTSGVQERHYDKHDYLPEKAEALTKWEAEIDRIVKGEPAKVVHGRFGRRVTQVA